ncbi:class I SAM-dependent methyltransferase [Eremococcus coleocola]|uniref:Methyltransferase domain protein n=1 Tax=Eremococcus coleocola ACS-139-V-Col8 TaxID=908337 RepID=E4KRH8_9LACT|nr:class I SAM-dependent methyltransferase [Eremococcus coleocola]EFR30454.1 methyltransferase domain protein [Eremococcus coleocola ACS-139-V-Col8]
MKSYQDINKETIDKWVEEGWEWAKSISHEEYNDAKNGNWNVLLTPTVPVPHEWIGNIKDKKILGLASGGGQQMPIFNALGAKCSVLDYSSKQIESEYKVAKREGYTIEAIEGDMTKKLPFDDETFDIVFHPVSNCYVEDVQHIFNEVYRVLKKGGIFLAGLNNEINYIVDQNEKEIVWKMPFNPLKDEKAKEFMVKENAGMQFSHNMTEQIGGQLKAGFTLVDIYEDTNGFGRLHELNIKTYIATKSIKK